MLHPVMAVKEGIIVSGLRVAGKGCGQGKGTRAPTPESYAASAPPPMGHLT
ncbi:hypothetical protein [Sphingobium sp. MK2]|uniref:hypothetical protein n=1 Tax=Sphingobium sp. MK2 TaxID=3116540 RepID=UPI0032E36007